MVHTESRITECDLPPLAEIYKSILQTTSPKATSHPPSNLLLPSLKRLRGIKTRTSSLLIIVYPDVVCLFSTPNIALHRLCSLNSSAIGRMFLKYLKHFILQVLCVAAGFPTGVRCMVFIHCVGFYFILLIILKVELHERRGDPIPEGWGCDSQGKLVTDPKRVLSGGGLVPIGGSEATGGYKGYGLGMMVEVFCGILAGAQYSNKIRTWKVTDRVANLGQCFVAINPENFAPGFNDRMSDLLSIHRGMDPADPDSPVLAAGDPERMNMKKCEEMGGIPYHINVVNYMNECATRIGVSPLLPCDKLISV